MPVTQFDRDTWASHYAEDHIKTDPGIVSVYYLPTNAGDREIRFIVVSQLVGNRSDDALEPIDFGVDRGMDTEHKLMFVDVTPKQWERIMSKKLDLPGDWSLDDLVHYQK